MEYRSKSILDRNFKEQNVKPENGVYFGSKVFLDLNLCLECLDLRSLNHLKEVFENPFKKI